MDKSWLKKKLDLNMEQLSQQQHEHIRKARPDWIGTERDKPGGNNHQHWAKFAALYQEGDELWEFSSSTASWAALAGRAGFAILRNGEVIATFVTVLS